MNESNNNNNKYKIQVQESERKNRFQVSIVCVLLKKPIKAIKNYYYV